MLVKMTARDWQINNIIWLETIWVAVIYVIAARIGQYFAIPPGNVTPVWLPSGLMIALAIYRGPRIWLGVFLGAFAGNVWAYFSLDSITTAIAAILAGTVNGLGDVISTVLMAELIVTFCNSTNPLTSIKNYCWFLLFAVFLGSTISALFGVSGLVVFGFLEFSNSPSVLATWIVGDGVGALLFAPLLLSWLQPVKKNDSYFSVKLITLVLSATFVTAVGFELLVYNKWLIVMGIALLPLLLFLIVDTDQRIVFTTQVMVSTVAVYATINGAGPFGGGEENMALMQLQIFIIVLSLIIYIVSVFSYQKYEMNQLLISQKNRLEKLYRLDQLTGLWNRHKITEYLAHELSRYKREGRRFGLIMIDIDDFKKINDSLGHLVGDQVLVKLSSVIKKHTRDSDLFGRWGGEEFLVIVSNTNKETIGRMAEKIRNLIEGTNFGLNSSVTISAGVTLVTQSDDQISVMRRVDKALYLSKENTKNKVTFC